MKILLQNETQLKNLTNQLLQISTHVNEELIMKAALHIGCSYVSVKRYLNGQPKKEAIAKKLLKFFQENLQAA